MTDETDDLDTGDQVENTSTETDEREPSLFDQGSQVEKTETTEDGDDRPDWLDQRFWNAAKDAETPEARTLAAAQAQAKAYADLESQYGKLKRDKGYVQAPEQASEYDLTPPETAANFIVQGDDPLVEGYRETAHKLGLSKEQAAGVYQWFAQSVSDIAPEPLDMKAEMAKLGANAQAVIDDVVGRAYQFKEWGVFNDQDIEEYRVAVGTAEGMQMMQKLFAHYGEKAVPANVQPSGGTLPTPAELDAMKWEQVESGPNKGQVRYNVDAEYRAKIDKLFDQVYGADPAGSSRRVA